VADFENAKKEFAKSAELLRKATEALTTNTIA
jgi:hypothetical protein